MIPSMEKEKKQIVILLGPPGAGKGSQAHGVKNSLDLAHIATGDLLRKNIQEGTPLGELAKTFMDVGELVPDELIFDMLFTRASQPDCRKGYILDGFPRTLTQAKALSEKIQGDYLEVINLTISDAEIVDRIIHRVVCTGCQKPYHLSNNPPKQEGSCDSCHSPVKQRTDDTKEVIQNRLNTYHEKTAPLISFYESLGVLTHVDSTRGIDTVLKDILQTLSEKKAALGV